MRDATSTLSTFDRHSLFEACAREAKRLGGDERTAEYFFGRAQSSRVWLSEKGIATIADMDIADWCSAIAWAAPGVGRANQPVTSEETRTPAVTATKTSPTEPQDKHLDVVSFESDMPSKKQPRLGARAKAR